MIDMASRLLSLNMCQPQHALELKSRVAHYWLYRRAPGMVLVSLVNPDR